MILTLNKKLFEHLVKLVKVVFDISTNQVAKANHEGIIYIYMKERKK